MLRTNATTLSRSVPLEAGRHDGARQAAVDDLVADARFGTPTTRKPWTDIALVPSFAWHPWHLPSKRVLPTAASPVAGGPGVDVLLVVAGAEVLGVDAGGVDDDVLSPPYPAPTAASAITIPSRNFAISRPLLAGR